MENAAPHALTRIQEFDGWTAKREDEAFFTSADYPSGSKVRQYISMSQATPGATMIVGCSAHSAMQIYVAASAKQAGVQGIVYTAARKERTSATEYAIRYGAEVVEVRPAYLSVCRARAKARAKDLGSTVRWNPALAIKDTIEQCQNLPKKAKRIIVSTGSGLTCAGVLAGLAILHRRTPVVAVTVSPLADEESILASAKKATNKELPPLIIIHAAGAYDKWKAAILPDGTPLDPYYAAKALEYVKKGDCFWISGLRPLSSMPIKCQRAVEALQNV